MLSVSPARPVVAADVCTTVRTLVDHAPSGFAGIAGTPGDRSGGGVALALPGAERCDVTAQLDGKAYHCVWKYPYRSEAASAAFSELARAIERCVGDGATVRNDPRVNHPDSYDLRVYELERATVSVSVKDKVALDGTFLFVRVSP